MLFSWENYQAYREQLLKHYTVPVPTSTYSAGLYTLYFQHIGMQSLLLACANCTLYRKKWEPDCYNGLVWMDPLSPVEESFLLHPLVLQRNVGLQLAGKVCF